MLSSFVANLRDRLEVKQAIKTALVAIISFYVSTLFNSFIPRPDIFVGGLWCVVASIVVLQPLIGGTYKAVINRFLGVLIGSFLGALFCKVWGGGSEVLGLAIFSTILICSLLNLKESYRIAALSVTVVIIPWTMHPDFTPWSFAFFRFIDTCLGIAVAVLITHLVWPSQAGLTVQSNISRMLSLLNQLCKSVFIVTEDKEHKKIKMQEELVEDIRQLLTGIRVVLDESRLERIINTYPVTIWEEIIGSIEKLFIEINSIKDVFTPDLKNMLDEPFLQELNEVEDKINRSLKNLSERIADWSIKGEKAGLRDGIEKLNEQLIRFRNTRATRTYEFEYVERYFVFFYSLKSILHELRHLNGLMDSIQKEVEGDS